VKHGYQRIPIFAQLENPRGTIGRMGKRLTAVLAIFALVVAPLGTYVGGYFLLGEWHQHYWRDGLAWSDRVYSQPWLAAVFQPAAWVEGNLRGIDVRAVSGSRSDRILHH